MVGGWPALQVVPCILHGNSNIVVRLLAVTRLAAKACGMVLKEVDTALETMFADTPNSCDRGASAQTPPTHVHGVLGFHGTGGVATSLL